MDGINKSNCNISILIKYFSLIGILLFSACKKDVFAWNLKSRPELSEISLKSNSPISFICSANLKSNGNDNQTEKGFCWSNSENATISDNKIISNGSETGVFDSEITWSSTSDIYIRAYAKNSLGVVYSTEIKVSWPGDLTDIPIVETTIIDNIDFYQFNANGLILSNGGMQLSNQGFILSTATTPTFANGVIIQSNANLDTLHATITSLNENTTYYIRSFATNIAGTGYGNTLMIQTQNFYQVGEIGPAGGYIFYSKLDNSDGWNFLEAAPTNTNSSSSWGPLTNPTSINNGSIGSGFYNSVSLLTILGNPNNYAVNNTDNYQYNGYSDWYLPSRDELAEMRTQLFLQNIGNFSNSAYYWTSTEDNNFNQNAWVVKMSSASTIVTLPKNGIYLTRAIRKF